MIHKTATFQVRSFWGYVPRRWIREIQITFRRSSEYQGIKGFLWGQPGGYNVSCLHGELRCS